MAEFRPVTGDFAVSPQIAVADVARARADGFTLIVNNRPDGESVDQPAAREIEDAARANGLGYVHIPVTGRPTPEEASAMARAMASAGGPTLAFCRSGTRSIMTWAMGQMAVGGESRAELIRKAAAAGYDLSVVLPD